MASYFEWTLRLALLILFMSSFTQCFDCYYCPNCLNNERGVRMSARPGEWCYKIVWPPYGGIRRVSRGASADCRQSTYNDPSMSVPGVFFGVARYCCRSHLCNAAPKRTDSWILTLLSFPLVLNFFSI